MDNELRERIMDLLTRTPGCYLGKMGRDLGVPTSTLKYHLNILRSFDLVSTVKKGRCRHYFPKRRRFTDSEKRMFSALEHAPTRRMVEIIRQAPGISQAGLVQRTGLSQSTVAWHMGKLEEMMLVTSERHGVKAYYLTPEFQQAFDLARGEPHARPVDLNSIGEPLLHDDTSDRQPHEDARSGDAHEDHAHERPPEPSAA